MNPIEFYCAGVVARLDLDVDPAAEALLRGNFEALSAPGDRAGPVLEIAVSGSPRNGGYCIRGGPQDARLGAVDVQVLVHEVETILVPGLQLLRPERLFLHAAALELDGRVFLVTGPSGGGKSTLAWALCHHGCRYLSDELAPLDIDHGVTVTPYLHALNLKRCPGSPYRIPEGTPYTGWTYHIPTHQLPGGVRDSDAEVSAVIFIEGNEPGAEPRLTPVAAAESALRLYPNVLNALAHPQDGLAAVRQVAERVRGWRLTSGNLPLTVQRVLDVVRPS